MEDKLKIAIGYENAEKELMVLFSEIENQKPAILLEKAQNLHKNLIVHRAYNLISIVLSCCAILKYKLSSDNYKIATRILNDAKFLALNGKDKKSLAVNEYCEGVIQYYEGALGDAYNTFSKINTDDLPFESLKKNIQNILKNLTGNSTSKDTQEEPYTALLNVARTLAAETNTDTLLKTVAEEIKKVLNADRCTVFLLDKEKNELWSKVALGLESKEIRFSADSGIAGYSAKTGEIINIKDTFLNEGFKEGINEIVDSAIDLGKSVIGIFTGKFENISQVQTAVKSGGIIDSTSNLIDFVLNKIQKNDLLSNTTINIIKKGKDLLLDNVNKNIENTLTKQVTSIEKLNEYSENWNKYFELKDFNNMDKEFEKIQSELKEVIPLENTLKQVRKIENIHNLIKNNGQNFDISEIEKELAAKL